MKRGGQFPGTKLSHLSQDVIRPGCLSSFAPAQLLLHIHCGEWRVCRYIRGEGTEQLPTCGRVVLGVEPCVEPSVIVPAVLTIINMSLTSGSVPDQFKTASV